MRGISQIIHSIHSVSHLVLDAELGVVPVQGTEAVVETHQTVPGPERGLVVRATTLARATIGTGPNLFFR